MKYFANITIAEELKKEFRALSIKLHPDTGGNASDFAEMLNEYEQKRAELNGEPITTSRARRSSLWAVRGRRMIYEYTYTTYIFVLVNPEKGEFLRVFSHDFASVEDVESYEYTETRTQEKAEFIRPYSQKHGIGYYWDDNAPLYTEAEITEFEKRAQNFEHWREIYELQEVERERKEKAERFAEYLARCKKWAHLLQEVPAVTETAYNDTRKAQERKAHAVRRANVLAMARAVFPGVKFSLTFSHSWGGGFTLSWTDGPTKNEVRERCDFELFVSSWDTFDGMTDSAGVESAEFTEFAKKYGNFRGSVDFDRKTSKKVDLQILEAIGKICPEFAEDVKQYKESQGHARRYPSRTMSREQAEQIAKEAGATNWDTMQNGYRWGTFEDHEIDTFIYMIGLRCSFAVVEEDKKPVFIPKHNDTYKAVKKAMGAHCIGKRSLNGRYMSDNKEILNIYALVDFVTGCNMYFGNVYNNRGIMEFSSFWSSSHANDAKRIARYKAAGIEIKASGQILAISPEVIEGLKADRESVEAQRKAWEEAQQKQNEPKAKKQPKQTAEASAKAETVAEGETLAEADGVQLIATEQGAKFTGNTYAHKDEIKATGARWFRLGQYWTIKAEQIAEAVEMVNSWNTTTDNEPQAEPQPTADTLHDAENITDTAEAVNAEPTADDQTAEAVARVALAFVELCQMLQDVAKAQQEEAEANEAKARKAARAQEVQTLREGIATLSAQLATMSEQLRTMSDRLEELTTQDTADTDPQPTAPNEGGTAEGTKSPRYSTAEKLGTEAQTGTEGEHVTINKELGDLVQVLDGVRYSVAESERILLYNSNSALYRAKNGVYFFYCWECGKEWLKICTPEALRDCTRYGLNDPRYSTAEKISETAETVNYTLYGYTLGESAAHCETVGNAEKLAEFLTNCANGRALNLDVCEISEVTDKYIIYYCSRCGGKYIASFVADWHDWHPTFNDLQKSTDGETFREMVRKLKAFKLQREEQRKAA